MNTIPYWNDLWKERMSPGCDYELRNGEKAKHLINELWMKPQYIKKKKLDIGCGTGFHIKSLMENCKEWGENYWGVDLSEEAIGVARERGLNAQVMDISDFKSSFGFELFLLLDTLEHIEDHEGLANKIMGISADKFTIFGNVPLYHSASQITNGGFEHSMDVIKVNKFIKMCGIKKFYCDVYGIDGWPYMTFEAIKK
jgi:SAM-dependent methyltransferase